MKLTKEEKKSLKPTSTMITPSTKTNNHIHNRVAKHVTGVFKRKGFGLNYFNKKDS